MSIFNFFDSDTALQANSLSIFFSSSTVTDLLSRVSMAKNDASFGSVGEFLKWCQQSGEPSTIDISRDHSQTGT
ncbi:hypothetical protein RchiOBHm_Chr7g0195931 [Rosa chinensis]|uniref:Uncharacterized protein n=1 Tax=Rosa chinensis TaxID=74649 RepID=A0A2P6P6J7_ROSCH|nr:hypothetical protein RchiOBHm_Chr7g0195931 [Rosa chinensis]